MYNYLTDDDDHVDKKTKGTKKSMIKREIIFQDNKECLENNKTVLRSQQMFWSEVHNVFIESQQDCI